MLATQNAPVVGSVLVSDRIPPLWACAAESSFESRTGREKGKRVLVIDDENFIADTTAEILNSYGYDAVAVYSGQSAIDLARTQCPDIILSDVIMPRLNGVDTAVAIRKLCPATRVLLFSGQAGTADLLRKARAEGHDFELLSKPLHPEELLKKLAAS